MVTHLAHTGLGVVAVSVGAGDEIQSLLKVGKDVSYNSESFVVVVVYYQHGFTFHDV